MKISSFLAFLALAACSVSSCKGSKASLHEDVLKNVNRTLVSERFNFFEDFRKFCRTYEKERWLNLSKDVVCLGSRGKNNATVVIPMEGFLMSIKLVHDTGRVTCDNSATQYNRKWGCSRRHPVHGGMPFSIVITTGKNDVILFPKELSLKGQKESLWYDIPKVDPDSAELMFGDSSYPNYVAYGQELRVWFGEELTNSEEKNKNEIVCIRVKGWYMH